MPAALTLPRILGALLSVLGLVVALKPSLAGALTGAATPAPDLFEAVEQRVRPGMVFGVGLVLLAHVADRPWTTHLASAVFYWVFGVLIVRVLGILLDGGHPKQWMWVAAEGAIVALAAAWLWRAAAA